MAFEFITELLKIVGISIPQAGMVIGLMYAGLKWRRIKKYAGKGAGIIGYIVSSAVIIGILLAMGVISGFHPERLLDLLVSGYSVVAELM